MKKFKVEVERVDEYEIEFDEEIINDEFMKDYKEFFSDIETLEEHAENIAVFRARFGERFIEGYGNPMVNGRSPFMVKEEDVERGINIKVISEGDFDNMYVEVKEINQWTFQVLYVTMKII